MKSKPTDLENFEYEALKKDFHRFFRISKEKVTDMIWEYAMTRNRIAHPDVILQNAYCYALIALEYELEGLT